MRIYKAYISAQSCLTSTVTVTDTLPPTTQTTTGTETTTATLPPTTQTTTGTETTTATQTTIQTFVQTTSIIQSAHVGSLLSSNKLVGVSVGGTLGTIALLVCIVLLCRSCGVVGKKGSNLTPNSLPLHTSSGLVSTFSGSIVI